jgi:hypothetical protein
MSKAKISIRFFDDSEVRAVWDEENSQVVSAATQLKFLAPDGKKRLADMVDYNGRSTRIWLELILKKRLKKCVDWSKIGKRDYMNAMMQSSTNSSVLKKLLKTL